MTYNEAIDFLFNSINSYHNQGSKAIRPGLKNIISLCNHLKNPQNFFKIIHVGGTNGKGSSAYGISNILIHNKLSVGLFTSPHIHDFRERIQVDGSHIDKAFVVDFINSNKKIIDKISPSFFELTTAMAFKYFQQKCVDIAVIEVGLGGRLDSTNIVDSDVVLITNIGYDHQNILGHSLDDIAKEKVGIIKEKSIFIKGEKQDEIDHIFFKNEKKHLKSWRNLELKSLKKNIDSREYEVKFKKMKFKLDVSNPTNYFKKNIPGIIISSYYMLKKFNIDINSKSFNGINKVCEINKIMCRWDLISKNPLIIADGCHNKPSFEIVIDEINSYKFSQVYFIIGGTKEKNWPEICKILPSYYKYILTQPNNERSLSIDKLKKEFDRNKLNYLSFSSFQRSINYCKKNARKNDLIFIGGSLFMLS